MTTSGARADRGGKRRRASGRKQEVGEDDVGPPAPGGGSRRQRQPGVLGRRPAAATDRHHLDLVSERLDLAPQRNQEAAEVRVGGTRPHLGHEQNAHGGDYLRTRTRA